MANTKKGAGAAAGDLVYLEGEDYTVKGIDERGCLVMESAKGKDGKVRTVKTSPDAIAVLDDLEGTLHKETMHSIKFGNPEERTLASAATARKALAGRKKTIFYLPGRLMPPGNRED